MGVITELATSAPGYNSMRPNTCAPLAQTLRLNGYSTAQFGKCHEVPVWQSSPMGPFDAWPTGGGGFEYFYGFIGGETNQYYPAIYEGTTPVEPEKTPEEGYHFTEDMTDRAITWMRQQKSLMPDKPFFVYFAPGATHAPHHVPKEWSDKYKGRFDEGWDALREEIFARQKELGVIPPDAELTERHEEIPAWDDMPDEMKPVLARQMEVYAGFLEHTDHHVGRLVDALEDLGVLEDTLVYYIVGDNGASRRGHDQRDVQRDVHVQRRGRARDAGVRRGAHRRVRHPELPTTTSRSAGRTRWTRPTSGRSRLPRTGAGRATGRSCTGRAGSTARGEIRSQFHHVIDVAPTVLEAAGLPHPTTVDGVEQHPIEGTSMLYSFDGATEADRRETQYFEMFCNRGIYHQGWTAVTRHSIPWMIGTPLPPFDDDVWELYEPGDWSQAHDRRRGDAREARGASGSSGSTRRASTTCCPLDDRRIERFNADLVGRPLLVKGNSQLLFGGMGRLSESSVLNVKNKSHAVTAEVVVPEAGAEGVIIAQGGAFAGWSLYAKDGRPTYCYNLLGLQRFKVEGDAAIPPGTHQVRMEFAYDGGGLAKGGTVTLYVDGEQVGEGRVEATVPMIFSGDETADVGPDTASPVSDDYGRATTSSPARSTGCRSISARTPRTPTT